MSIRTFIFCDGCNPQGVRNVYENEQYDRRNSDGRSWCEGSLEEAVKLGWEIFEENKILCPHCVASGMAGLLRYNQQRLNETQINR